MSGSGWRRAGPAQAARMLRLPVPAAALLAAAILAPATAAEGYRFTAGEPILLRWRMEQETAWRSAGDRLDYATAQEWDLVLTPGPAGRDGRIPVQLLVARIRASHRGPEGERRFDSRSEPGTRRDPLLGHLDLLCGTPVVWMVDPRTGAVASATGGAQILDRLREHVPAAIPGEPSPIEAAARQAFGDEALARLGDSLLRLPAAATESIRLGPPLSIEVARGWSGARWNVRQSATVPMTLGSGPAAVAGAITGLSGSGEVQPRAGRPDRAHGEWRWTQHATALTQPFQAEVVLRWRLEPR